ncbi:Outer membrane receptor for ferrienterochelin and colicins [Bacteroidales bacterium Barb6XT]|nr:Outer membrane receptor for ferrienterochelin and colicins [Bacteroidales bacterium Barb6XT]
MGTKIRYFFALIVLFFAGSLSAQTVINGRVTDSQTNEPIAGATLLVKSAHEGTTTDFNGKFVFHTQKKLPLTLVVSFIGYRAQEIDVYDTEEPLVITLAEHLNVLNEIVVTGVAEGTSRKKLSFALTKIDSDLINTVPATDASTSLRGKVAGIRIDQPGGNQGASVYLRGAKSVSGDIAPLIVVDGFVTGLKLSDINPADIEAIEVVKGAAASALYGTRGEGGIIQVLTKKGRKSGSLDITVDNEFGINSVQHLPPTSKFHHFKVNADGSFALSDGARVIDYQENGFSVNLHPYKDFHDNTKNVLGNKGYFTNSVSVAASGDKHTIYVSAQNQSRGGVSNVVDADTKQNLLFNLEYKVSDKIDADLTAQYSDASTPSSAVSSRSDGLLYSTLLLEPFINIAEKEADGTYPYSPAGSNLVSNKWSNPLYDLSTHEYSYKTENLLLGGKLRYRITKHLSAEGSVSLQNRYYNTESYYPIGFKTVSTDITKNNGNYGLETSRESTKNGQIQLNYSRKTGDFDWGTTVFCSDFQLGECLR